MSRSEYAGLVCGTRLLANLGNDDGLEIDAQFCYYTYDNGRDLRVWRFPIPTHLSEQDLTAAFYEYPNRFRGWLIDRGIQDEEYDWLSHGK